MRCFFIQKLRKSLGLVLFGMIFFLFIGSVYAKMLSIDEVNTSFKTNFIDVFNQLGGNISSKVDTTNKVLDIYSEDVKFMSLKYTDEYIEYDNRDAIVSKDTAGSNFGAILFVDGLMRSIFKLSGYENKDISSDQDIDFKNTYDTYGIQMETEHYQYSGEEDGGTWSMEGDYLKYFKMSFDTDKIKALIEKYGVDLEESDPNKEIVSNLIPTLESKDVAANSVTLYPHVSYINTDSNYKVYCYIYRSESEDGEYQKVSDVAVSCLDGVGLTDENLKSNTTYYYKALVDGGTKYSDILKVTTSGNESVVSEEKVSKDSESFENPKTGVIISIVSVLVIMIGSIVSLVYAKKKSEMKKI